MDMQTQQERDNLLNLYDYMAQQLGYITASDKNSIRYAEPEYKGDFLEGIWRYSAFDPVNNTSLLNELLEHIRSTGYSIEFFCFTDSEIGETDALKWVCKIRRGKEYTANVNNLAIYCLVGAVKMFFVHQRLQGHLPTFPRETELKK